MKKLLKLVRWDDWYDSKLPLFFLAYYYLLFIRHEVQLQNLVLLLPLGGFFVSLITFGYMLNDYSDKFVDRISGKDNAMNRLNNWQQILALVSALVISLVVFIPFYQYKMATITLFFSYLSSVLYSIYPFRLKEKGIWGIICASLAQRVFPILTVFAIFEHFRLDTLIFSIISFLIGVRWILIHQLHDRNKDMQGNVKTFAVSEGLESTYNLLLLSFVMEIISAVVLVVFITYHIGLGMLPLLIVYFIYELYVFPFFKKLGFKRMLSSYDYAPLADFYFFWLPLWISILLGWLNPLFFVISVLEILWKVRYIKFNLWLIRLRNNA